MSIAHPPPAQKFLFNRTFDGAQVELEKPKEPPPPTFSQGELEAARAAAQQQGYAAGEQAAQETQQAQLVALTGQIERQMEKLLRQSLDRQDGQQADISEITLAIARKLLPEIVAEHALTGIAAILAQVCKEMAREPRLVVRVADAMLDPLKQQLDELMRHAAYSGKIVLLADDTLLPADCKIEWADGGIERNTAVVWQQIDEAVRQAKALAAAAPLPAPPSPSVQE